MKGNLTPFSYFMQIRVREFVSPKKMNHHKIIKKIGREWASLSAEEKHYYKLMSNKHNSGESPAPWVNTEKKIPKLKNRVLEKGNIHPF